MLRKLTMKQLVDRQRMDVDARTKGIYAEEIESRLARGDRQHYSGPFVPFPRRKTPGSSFRRLARGAPTPERARRDMRRAMGVSSQTKRKRQLKRTVV